MPSIASPHGRITHSSAAKHRPHSATRPSCENRRRLALAAALVTAVALLAAPVKARAQAGQPITVANGSVSGLITAIQTLNANGGGTIELATNGTCSVTAPSDWWYGPNAFPAISSNIVIEGNGATISRASGSPKFRFFFVSGGLSTLAAGTLTLQNLTLSGGLAQGGAGGSSLNSGGGGGGFGGALYNQGTTYLSSVTFTQNQAIGGSGGNASGSGGNSGGGGMGGNGGVGTPYSGSNVAGGGGFQGNGSYSTGGNFVGSEGGTFGGGGGSGYGGNGGAGSPSNGYAAGGGGGGYAPGQNGGVPNGDSGGVGAYAAGSGGVGGNQGEQGSGGGAFGGGGAGGADDGSGGGGIGGGGGGGFLSGGGGGYAGGGGGGLEPGPGGFGGGGGGAYQNGGSTSAGGFGGGNGSTSTGSAGAGAGFGGAIFNQLGTLTVMNSSFVTNTAIAGSGNGTATGGGGAIFNLNGTVTLESVTYSGNTATTSGGTALSGAMFYNLSHNGGNTTATATSTAQLTLVDMTISTANGDLYNNQVNGTATVTTVTSQPVASLSADSLAFGNQRLNVTTPAQTVTLTNTGTSPLSISGVALAGSGYQLTAKTCGTTLNANASCTASVDFQPTTGGEINGTLTFTDNSYASSSQMVALSGHGVAVTQLAYTTAPPTLLTAGGNVGTLTVQEEDANGSLDTYANDAITLVVTGPGNYSATYNGTASAGVLSFNLSGVALSTAGTYTYTVSSTGLTSATATTLVVRPSTNLGSAINVGSAASPQLVTVYLANGGAVASVAVLTQGMAGLDFTATTGGTCTATTYSAGQECTVNVVFTPALAGARTGAVVLRDAGGNALATQYIYGTGIGAQAGFGSGVKTEPFNFSGHYPAYGFAFDIAGNLYYADITDGTILRAPLVAGVYGPAVTIGSGYKSPASLMLDGAGNVYVAQYPYFANGQTIPPNGGYGSVTEIPLNASGYGAPVVIVSQVPTLFGAALAPSGTMYLTTGTYGLYEASLTAAGYGTPVQISGTPASAAPVFDAAGNVYFTDTNSVYVLTTTGATRTLYLQGAPANCSPIALATDLLGNLYIVDGQNNDVLEVAPGNITFRTVTTLLTQYSEPFVATDSSNNLYLYDNSKHNLIKYDVADPPALNFASTAVGSSSATQTVTVNSIGNATLVFSSVAPSSTNFSLAGSGCTSSPQLSVGSSCNLVVAFTPQSGGALTGYANLTGNDESAGNTVQSLPLTGTGLSQPVFGTMSILPSSSIPVGTSEIVTLSDTLSYTGTQPTGAVTFTLNSTAYTATCSATGSPETCTYNVPAATIAALSATTYQITVTLAADSTHASATGANGSLTITRLAQTITFPQPVNAAVGSSATLTATASSGLAVTYAITGGTGSATLSGSTITYTGAGTVIITASQAGNATYAPATSVADTVTVILNYVVLLNNNATVSRLSDSGGSVSNFGTSAGSAALGGLAFDAAGNTWSVLTSSNLLSFATSTGGSPASYGGGGLSAPVSIAVDGQGSLWVANSVGNSVSVFSNSGKAEATTAYSATASQAPTSVQGTPSAIILDSTGGVWVTNKTGNSVTHIFGAATPVITPLSRAVTNNTLATKP